MRLSVSNTRYETPASPSRRCRMTFELPTTVLTSPIVGGNLLDVLTAPVQAHRVLHLALDPHHLQQRMVQQLSPGHRSPPSTCSRTRTPSPVCRDRWPTRNSGSSCRNRSPTLARCTSGQASPTRVRAPGTTRKPAGRRSCFKSCTSRALVGFAEVM